MSVVSGSGAKHANTQKTAEAAGGKAGHDAANGAAPKPGKQAAEKQAAAAAARRRVHPARVWPD